MELPFDSAIPLLGPYLEKTKTMIQKDTCIPIFIGALLLIANILRQPRWPSINRLKDVIYIKIEYYSATNKNEIFATTWMDLC